MQICSRNFDDLVIDVIFFIFLKIVLPRKEGSVATLFAALRMRRVLHRVQAEHESSGPRAVVDETKANLERHLKVLSRYKIRQVDTDGDEARHLRNLPPFMVNPHSALYKIWQLVRTVLTVHLVANWKLTLTVLRAQITLIIIIYQSIMLPFNLAFGSNDTTAIDILMSSIFALDIIIAFNTPVVEDTDEMSYIMNRWHIASIYLRGWYAENYGDFRLFFTYILPHFSGFSSTCWLARPLTIYCYS